MHLLDAILNTGPQDITWWQMAARAVVIFAFAVVLLRVFFVRVFGRFSAMDTTVAILLGSTLSRALTGNARFVPSIVAAALLMGLHALLVWATVHFKGLGQLVKGRERRLIADGRMQHEAMERAGISEDDLREALRMRTGAMGFEGIDAAYLERNGSISFVRAHGQGA